MNGDLQKLADEIVHKATQLSYLVVTLDMDAADRAEAVRLALRLTWDTDSFLRDLMKRAD
ncbi:hypothetical protein [Thauera butanivorans]|uniref:hypothetical protein n=1 Tax=Thauera butanivorans TaxID=86174 RepID=UPI000837EA3D|nr:hypothetical protein [Thauera butanivorans]